MTFHKEHSYLDKHDGLFFRDEPGFCPGCVVIPDGEILCDRFSIKELLQTGINNNIYHAEDMVKGMRVVIKTADIGPHQEKLPGILLKLEMDTYRSLFSSGIIRVYDLHHADIGGTELLILSMESFGGQTLRQRLSSILNSNSQRDKGVEWFKKICRYIGHSHNTGIIHLNINPDHIFIKNDQIKISGFESSSFVRVNLMNKGLSIDSISRQIRPAYMSPELFNIPHPEELTLASDIYSLGIMLYKLLHPRFLTPFIGSYSALRDLHMNVEHRKIDEIDESLSGIIARCLKKRPSERFQTVWELLDALENKSFQKSENVEDPETLIQKKVDTKFQEARQAYDSKKFDKASRLIDEILGQKPKHKKTIQLQTILSEKYHHAELLYDEIKQQLDSENKDINLILALLKEATDIFPEHPTGLIIQHKLLKLSQLYKKLTEQGAKAFQNQNWSDALQFFEQAGKINPGSSALKIRTGRLKKIKQMKHEIDENLKNGDLEKARRQAYLTDLAIKKIKHSVIYQEGADYEL